MHLHLLGICGTFMGGLALLAREHGHRVSGQDAGVYPPMSTQLEAAGIELTEGYGAEGVPREADLVVIGNALSRGNPAVEFVLERGLPYTSGPQWLAEHVLQGAWTLAVAGTHGKTTTASMLAWILEEAGLQPGFLIGGVPHDFGVSARAGAGSFFVVEADEYDTAFFDKRAKFVHYRPRTAVLNNLEFDHADIYPDLASIQRQFHQLVRTVPGNGLIVAPTAEPAMAETLAMGCWSPVEPLETADGWHARERSADGSRFDAYLGEAFQGRVAWDQVGDHNVANGLAAIAAARHAGVPAAQGAQALATFGGVRRRLEVRGEVAGITVYDDFAHHPTAIATTLQGLRRRVGQARVLAVLEPRSNTMRQGVHRGTLAPSLEAADRVFLYQPEDLAWDLGAVAAEVGDRAAVCHAVEELVLALREAARPGDHILIMSNGAFGGIHERLLRALAE